MGAAIKKLRLPKRNAPIVDSKSKSALDVSSRRTPELVIAFVGAVGSGVTTVAKAFVQELEEKFGYETHDLKVSDLLRAQAAALGKRIDPKLPRAEQIQRLQDIGNELRRDRGTDFLTKLCIERIAEWRVKKGGYERDGDELGAPLPKRWVHIVNEIKHPDEVRMLRDVYGDLFWLIAVLADEESTKRELKKAGIAESLVPAIVSRDENESLPHGQKVRDTVQIADYLVRNDVDHTDQLNVKALRFLDLVFNIEVMTPLADEAGMSEAFAAAANSACLSRQVGAAAYSEFGELLGVGWNDVPKAGGGLYCADDGDDDNRCFRWGGKICHNDDRKDALNVQIIQTLRSKGVLRPDVPDDEVKFALKQTDIRNLIEFSRSVHAEMAALLAVARSGKMSLNDGTLYVTTFPCHSCARHIVAAGIRRVVYVEPYPKSLVVRFS